MHSVGKLLSLLVPKVVQPLQWLQNSVKFIHRVKKNFIPKGIGMFHLRN
jgi:hypothetical protein